MTDLERAVEALRLVSEVRRSNSMISVSVDCAVLAVEDLVDVLRHPDATLDEICELRMRESDRSG